MKALRTVDGRLREEAGGLRREASFSPLLHERVMESVRTRGIAPAQPLEQTRGGFWRLALPAGLAAALALGVWTGLRQDGTAPDPGPGQNVASAPAPTIKPVPSVAAAGQLPERPDPATDALERGKYAYLDRDAQRLLTFVSDQIPVLGNGK